MISSYNIIDEKVAQLIQQDYIIAAEHQRLVASVQGPSRLGKTLSAMKHLLVMSPESESRRNEANSYVRPEIQPSA